MSSMRLSESHNYGKFLTKKCKYLVVAYASSDLIKLTLYYI